MKPRHYILLALGGLMAFLAGFFIGKGRTDKSPGTVRETKETRVDTISYLAPVAKQELALDTRSYLVPSYCIVEPGPRQRIEKNRVSVDTISSCLINVTAEVEPGCSNDSAIVDLPVIQRHYADSTYEAWVSGPIDPRLDSMRVFAPTTVITKRDRDPQKRWHIGVTAGYGYGAKGFQPYIGVGITYSIFSF